MENNHKLIGPNILPKSDARYIKWRESLKKRPAPWCKGLTKETSASVKKISQTFKKKKIDNFAKWREQAKKLGKIRSEYPAFKRSGDLAELIGVVLGDGHIDKFPRVEGLLIFSDSRNSGFIQRYALLVEKFFDKKPVIYGVGNGVNCTRIRIYQKYISKRLGVPTGKRTYIKIAVPNWIVANKDFLIRYLRGLYEAEGSFCVHKPTGTYKFLFSNRNECLRNNVYKCLRALGFHPHVSGYQVQISKKEEVYKCKELLKFRQY